MTFQVEYKMDLEMERPSFEATSKNCIVIQPENPFVMYASVPSRLTG